MKPILLFLALILTALPLQKVQAQATPRTPNLGSQERSEILDALRRPVQITLKQPVLFKNEVFQVQGTWAFLKGTVLQPNGKAMDYQATPYQEQIKEGVFDDWFCALLRLKNDKWTVVQWQIGATDVPYVGWAEEFKAPSAIFPK